MGPISASLDGAGKAELNCISLIQLAKGEEFNGSISRRFLLRQSPSLAKPAKVSHQDKAFVLSHKSDAPQKFLGDLGQQTGRGENYSVSLEGNSKLGVLSVFLLNTVTLGIFQGLVVVHDIRPV
jgi:hypothetical protein